MTAQMENFSPLRKIPPAAAFLFQQTEWERGERCDACDLTSPAIDMTATGLALGASSVSPLVSGASPAVVMLARSVAYCEGGRVHLSVLRSCRGQIDMSPPA